MKDYSQRETDRAIANCIRKTQGIEAMFKFLEKLEERKNIVPPFLKNKEER